MNKEKNIHVNMALNIMRTLLSVVFPLLSYPYATRVLQVENYGKVSFSQSVISYFVLVAALGISSYAIREGGIYKSDRNKIDKFASEIFTINIISTLIAYFILIIVIFMSPKLFQNRTLLLLLSITVILTTISVDWINVIFEDYLFITVRSFIIQCITLVMLFIFIKKPDDYFRYAALQVLNGGLIAISNFIYTRKLCTVKIVKKLNLKHHLKPILIMFSNSMAVSVYLNVDNVMLGLVRGECAVGLYSVSVKVYTILKQLVASIYNVTITRLTHYLSSENLNAYKKLLNDVLNNLIFLSIPIVAGIMCTAPKIILVLAGSEYIQATLSLRILAVAIFFAVLGGALANCVNFPNKRESKNLVGTSLSAIINLLLNMVAIPIVGINGAALTTLVAELLVFLYLLFSIKEFWSYFDWRTIGINIVKSIIATIPFYLFRYLLDTAVNIGDVFNLIIMILLSLLSYASVGIAIKNSEMIKILHAVRNSRG